MLELNFTRKDGGKMILKLMWKSKFISWPNWQTVPNFYLSIGFFQVKPIILFFCNTPPFRYIIIMVYNVRSFLSRTTLNEKKMYHRHAKEPVRRYNLDSTLSKIQQVFWQHPNIIYTENTSKNGKCHLCQVDNNNETLQHLFFQCPSVTRGSVGWACVTHLSFCFEEI